MNITLQELGLPSDVLLWEAVLLTVMSFGVGIVGGFVGLALGTVRLPVLLMLGDNIIEYNLAAARRNFEAQGRGARIILTRVKNPSSYGVVEIGESEHGKAGRIERITEKPASPKSNLVQTGIYFYDERVFEIVSNLRPSERGELEITDVNTYYLQEGNLEYDILEGFWADCGESFETYLESQNLVAAHGANKMTELK